MAPPGQDQNDASPALTDQAQPQPQATPAASHQPSSGAEARYPAPPEELSDGTVTLRRWQPSDAQGSYEAVTASLAELAPWMPWAARGYSRDGAAEFISMTNAAWDSGKTFDYAVLVDGQINGGMGLMTRRGPGGLEIGYWVASRVAGRGVATRAVRLLVRTAFDIGAEYVQISHEKLNERSGAIPRRLGFTCLGETPPLPPSSRDEVALMWQLDRGASLN